MNGVKKLRTWLRLNKGTIEVTDTDEKDIHIYIYIYIYI
jgi:hypothetical protein